MEKLLTANLDQLSKSLLIGPTNPLTKDFCSRMKDAALILRTHARHRLHIHKHSHQHTQLHTAYSAVCPVSQRCDQSINQTASMPINTVSEANAQNTDRRDRMLFRGDGGEEEYLCRYLVYLTPSPPARECDWMLRFWIITTRGWCSVLFKLREDAALCSWCPQRHRGNVWNLN